MKILATSDMHGNLDGINLDGIDVAFFAGDIAPLRGLSYWDVYDQLEWMNTEFYSFCLEWPKAKIVFAPGNHDFFPLAKEKCRGKLGFKGLDLSLNLAQNATMLLDNSTDINGLKVYGTPWVPIINHRWAFEAYPDLLKRKFSAIPHGLDVLLVHSPPRLGLVDVSLEYGPESDKFGSHELVEEIAAKEPKICFCGHIHSGSHDMAKLCSTEVWNVSRVNESYEIAYDPLIVEL